MTEDEVKGYPVGSRVRYKSLGEGTVTRHELCGQQWRVWTQFDDERNELYSTNASGLELIGNPKTDTAQWFDEKLAPKREVKKEWEPDKGINWEAHKGFMRNL